VGTFAPLKCRPRNRTGTKEDVTLARLGRGLQVRCALLSCAKSPLTAIFIFIYIHNVECLVLFEEQESVTYSVELLARLGIEPKFRHSSGISGSRHPHMRELRIQHQGRPYRVLYVSTRNGMPCC